MLNYKVEIGFEKLTSLGSFFTLDDPTKGQLDNTTYTIAGGGFFYDVTQYVKTISTDRGKSRELDRYTSGGASVVFDNRTRVFDPTYTLSPFYGEIVPRRKLRISINGLYLFVGVIQDWNLAYNSNGQSEAEAVASDAFSILANLTLSELSYSAELSGTRINNILDDPLVSWPVQDREIDAGNATVTDDVIPANANALTYLQSIETSEPGELFISGSGSLTFKQRNPTLATIGTTFADDGTGVSYSNLQVTYGSELLYNEVIATSSLLTLESSQSDTASQEAYGISTLNVDTLLDSQSDLDKYAQYVLGQYNEPEYRFEALTVDLKSQAETIQNEMLGLEIGDVVLIKFTPNGISPAIEEYAKIVKIDHSSDVSQHTLTFGFATIENINFVLDSPAFGRLDVNKLAW